MGEKEEKKRGYPIEKGDLLKIKKCPLCGSGKISPMAKVYLKSGFNFFSTGACRNCLFVFRTVSPSLKWFRKCWRKIKSDRLEVFSHEVEKTRLDRYREYYQIIAGYKKRGRLLDVGAAYGTGADFFRKQGFTVEATEPEINKANYLRNFFKITVAAPDIEKLVLKKNKKYDVIIFSQCLEHIDRPVFVIARLKNLLRTGGIVYLEVPLLWDYVSWSDALFLTHKSNFSEENLLKLATENGFVVLEKYRFESWNLGLVMSSSEPVQIKPENRRTRSRGAKSVEDVKKMYRQKLPLKKIPPLGKVLRYRVPFIEHFFQTVNLEKREPIEPKGSGGFITFATRRSDDNSQKTN